MILKYLGHSAFTIKTKDARLLMDPYDASIGMKLPKVEADIVTISHHHSDHDSIDAVSGDPLVVDWPGEYEKSGIRIIGVSTYHDAEKGAKRGENTVFVVEADGVRIAHLGDLGHTLTDAKIDEIGDVDVLLVPVGGHYTINAKQAVEVARKVGARIVIPMHFNRPELNTETFGELTDLQTFLREHGTAEPEELDQLSLKSGETREGAKIVVLKS